MVSPTTFATLYTKEENARSTGITTVAKVNKLGLDVVIVDPAKGLKAEELEINPMGKVPFMIQKENGFKLSECMAIAIYLASQNEKTTLLGKTKQHYAEIIKWMSFANTEVMTSLAGWFRPLLGLDPYNKKSIDTSQASTRKTVSILDNHLRLKTYLVGERISLADYFVAGICARGFQYVFDKSFRSEYPSFTRWWATIANQEDWTGKHDFIDEAIKYTPPAKPAKEPKQPKPAPAAAKVAKEDDADEDEAPPPPKPKHPLENLGKATLVLDEWKRTYSNTKTREEALPWFWENYKPDEYSLYRVDYKYNDELTLTFKSANLIGGFFNRLEASRKYLFGSLSVYGEDNNSIVRGAFLVRGQEALPAFDVAPDYESFEFTKLDPSKPEDKAFIEDEWSWDKSITVNGKEYPHDDGKVFK